MLEMPRTTLASRPTELLDRPFALRSALPTADRSSRVMHVLLVAPAGAAGPGECAGSQRRPSGGRRTGGRLRRVHPPDAGTTVRHARIDGSRCAEGAPRLFRARDGAHHRLSVADG